MLSLRLRLPFLLGTLLLTCPLTSPAQLAFSEIEALDSQAASDASLESQPELVTDTKDTWVAIWVSSGDPLKPSGADADLYFSRSVDGGSSWSAAGVIHTNFLSDSASDRRPKLATDGAGNWMAVWDSNETAGGAGLDSDIWHAVSVDDGLTWSMPRVLNSNALTDTGNDRFPAITSPSNGVWVVAWESDEPIAGTGSDQDILFTKSDDGGATWSTPAPVHSDAVGDTASDFTPALACDDQGILILAWAYFDDTSNIRYARSVDSGGSWATPAVLHPAPPDQGQDFSPTVYVSPNRTWLIAWESGVNVGGAIDEDQDILFVRSINAGISWSDPAALNTTATGPEDLDLFPRVASDGQGNWVAVWDSDINFNGEFGEDQEILVAYSTDDAQTWLPPAPLTGRFVGTEADDRNAVLGVDKRGHWVVAWTTDNTLDGTLDTDRDVVFTVLEKPLYWREAKLLDPTSTTDTGSDLNPQIATDGAGNLIAVWDSNDTLSGTISNDFDILVASSTDDGRSWSTPRALNINAANDQATDRNPEIATDGLGTWITVWDSTDPLGGTVGLDQDIFVSISTNLGATWSTPTYVNHHATNDMGFDFNAAVAIDPNGRVLVVWESDVDLGGALGNDQDILMARSTDLGASWEPARAGNPTADSDSGDDFDAVIDTDDKGVWVLAWMSNDPLNNTILDDDDILFTRSADGGDTWTFTAPLNNNAAVDDAEDDDFTPDLKTDGLGHWVCAWHSEGTLGGTIGTDADILAAVSVDNGVSWEPVQAVSSRATTDTGDDLNARVMTDEIGRWMIGWSSNEPDLGGQDGAANESDVAYAVSWDEGTTWLPPVPLAPGSDLDSSTDIRPAIVYTGTAWVALWSTRQDLIGADFDLLFSRAPEVNYPPCLHAIPNQTIPEGTAVVLPDVPFDDPNAGEVFSAIVDWGDGTVESVTVDPDGRVLSGGHVYDDDGIYVVLVQLEDGGQLTGETSFIVTVENTPALIVAEARQAYGPDRRVTLDDVRIGDASTSETLSATVDWGDNTTESITVNQASGELTAEHVYASDGAYQVTVTVIDGSGAETVQVIEAYPVLEFTNVQSNGGALELTWTGGVSPFYLESNDDLDFPVWNDLGPRTAGFSSATATDPVEMFRVRFGDPAADLGSALSEGLPPDVRSLGFGFGGDVTIDGQVDQDDVLLLQEAVKQTTVTTAEYDVDQNGNFGLSDAFWALDVYAKRIPACLDASFSRANPVTGDPAHLQVRGVNWDVETAVLLDGLFLEPNDIRFTEQGVLQATILFEEGTPEPSPTNLVSILSGDQQSNVVPVLFNQTVVVEQELPENLDELLQNAPRDQPAAAKTNCCIQRIRFSARQSGLKIYAFDETGRLANGSGLDLGAKTKLERDRNAAPGTPRCVTVLIFEGEKKNQKLIGQYSLSCESLKALAAAQGAELKTITRNGMTYSRAKDFRSPFAERFTEVDTGGGSRVRARTLFDVTEFIVKEDCGNPPANTLLSSIHRTVTNRDNQTWPGSTGVGSGAVSEFGVPLTVLSNAGCTKACWLQIVNTRIDVVRKQTGDRETIYQSDWHNDYGVPPATRTRIKTLNGEMQDLQDAIDEENKKSRRNRLKRQKKAKQKERDELSDNIEGANGNPWWCYKAEIDKWKTAGWLGVGDGPHLKHRGSYPTAEGETINLQKDDVLIRQSTFVTCLVCLEPQVELLACFMWSITTTYKHDPDDLTTGGSTTHDPPAEISLLPPDANGRFIDQRGKVNPKAHDILKKGLSEKTLKEFLKRKFENCL